jgi:hypothetical protein
VFAQRIYVCKDALVLEALTEPSSTVPTLQAALNHVFASATGPTSSLLCTSQLLRVISVSSVLHAGVVGFLLNPGQTGVHHADMACAPQEHVRARARRASGYEDSGEMGSTRQCASGLSNNGVQIMSLATCADAHQFLENILEPIYDSQLGEISKSQLF